MKQALIPHLKSAAITFATACGLELYAAMQAADTWSDIGWAPLLSAITFTAVRAVIKEALKR
jgi:outer membrane lipopolysaccharide assembly protein LptE/RlpB